MSNTLDKQKELNNTWKFLSYFNQNLPNDIGDFDSPYVFVSSYREYIIQTIRKKYTYQDFYKYEKILNKLFWILKEKLRPFIKNNKTKYKIIKNIENIGDYRSTTNSYIHFNDNDKKWYLLEGPSELDKICMNIMRNKKNYMKYYNNPEEIKKCKDNNEIYRFINYPYKNEEHMELKKYKNIIEFYYFMNYPFPNANPMFYNENKKSYWIKKIKKMYYTNSKHLYHNYAGYWYKLIKP